MPLNLVKNEKIVNTYALYIYGDISEEQWWESDVTPNMVNEALAKAGDAELVEVFINSYGGSVFAGHAIYNILKRHTALIRVYVDGIAASAASVILQAGDERIVAPNGIVMIHNPMGGSWGYAEDMRKYADTLDTIKGTIEDTYLEKVNIERDKLIELMDAETYMNASEAVEMGFVDSVVGENVAIQNKNGEIVINSVAVDKRRHKNIYKNSAKFKNYEPTPVVVDYSELELAIAVNEVTLLESERLSNVANNHYKRP
tara:strand:+ start:1841 stop:2614 length:774 start_codon:yes stop_codon:yes gene_type:complete